MSTQLVLFIIRGYGETDKPAGVLNYTIQLLKEDIVQLVILIHHK